MHIGNLGGQLGFERFKIRSFRIHSGSVMYQNQNARFNGASLYLIKNVDCWWKYPACLKNLFFRELAIPFLSSMFLI